MMPGWKKRWEERKPIIGHLKVLVYGIVNPLNNELFYIGVTQSPLRQRLSGHISGSVSKSLTKPSQRQLIIKSIIAAGLEPEIIEVDRVCLSEVCFWENFYIEYYKALGCNLCQLAKGPNYTISYGAIGGIYYMYSSMLEGRILPHPNSAYPVNKDRIYLTDDQKKEFLNMLIKKYYTISDIEPQPRKVRDSKERRTRTFRGPATEEFVMNLGYITRDY